MLKWILLAAGFLAGFFVLIMWMFVKWLEVAGL